MSRKESLLKYLLLIVIVYASSQAAFLSLNFFFKSEHPLVVVEGHSMEATFYDGDLLVVKGVENKFDIKLQDIIVFHEPYDGKKLIVHRVVERIVLDNQVAFKTKGDNNSIPDQWNVREVDVVGVVVARVPAIGSVFLTLQSPVGMMFTVILIIIIVGVNVFYNKEETPSAENSFISE